MQVLTSSATLPVRILNLYFSTPIGWHWQFKMVSGSFRNRLIYYLSAEVVGATRPGCNKGVVQMAKLLNLDLAHRTRIFLPN